MSYNISKNLSVLPEAYDSKCTCTTLIKYTKELIVQQLVYLLFYVNFLLCMLLN